MITDTTREKENSPKNRHWQRYGVRPEVTVSCLGRLADGSLPCRRDTQKKKQQQNSGKYLFSKVYVILDVDLVRKKKRMYCPTET